MITSLQEPENLVGFDYKAYLARQDVYTLMSWPALALISEGHGRPIYHGIYAFKDRAQQTIRFLFSSAHAALLSGILLGNDNEISPDLDDPFRTIGLADIIAISALMEVM